MIYELKDTTKAAPLFEGWNETLIYSCLQQVMGKVLVTDEENPKSAAAYVGCFYFFAGTPDRELLEQITKGFQILVPRNEEWAKLIEEVHPSVRKVTRYAIKKDTKFDVARLRSMAVAFPDEYELRTIDSEMYDKCVEHPQTTDLVAAFESKEKYLKEGRGVVLLKEGRIVAGASSYTRYKEGIEIEVDTIEEERRKHLATAACANLILNCLEEGLYPSWDAQNLNSVALSKTLGYEFDHEYSAYELCS